MLNGQSHCKVVREQHFLPWERNDVQALAAARQMLACEPIFTGEVAAWFLPYGPLYADAYDAQMIVMRAPEDAEVAGHLAIQFDHFSAYPERNNPPCPLWVRALPKFGEEGSSRESNARLAYRAYYGMAEDFAGHYPAHIRIMDLAELNSRAAQISVLHWCGYPHPEPIRTDARFELGA